jgi:hypothetical protein
MDLFAEQRNLVRSGDQFDVPPVFRVFKTLAPRQCNNRKEVACRAKEPVYRKTDTLRLNLGGDRSARGGK